MKIHMHTAKRSHLSSPCSVIDGSGVVVPGSGDPPVVLIVVVVIVGLLLCIVLAVLALCLLWCCVKINSQKRKRGKCQQHHLWI